MIPIVIYLICRTSSISEERLASKKETPAPAAATACKSNYGGAINSDALDRVFLDHVR